MSHVRVRGALLRLYPPHWRARYGDELDTDAPGVRRAAPSLWVSGRTWPRARREGLAFGTHRGRLRRASACVGRCSSCAHGRSSSWPGLAPTISEHWQDVTPASSRAVPSLAFDVLVGAAVGSAAVLLGVACALPAFSALLLGGGWHSLRRPSGGRRADDRRSDRERRAGRLGAHPPGAAAGRHYLLYGLGALACALVTVACLAAWTAAAVAAGSRRELSPGLLRLEAWLAAERDDDGRDARCDVRLVGALAGSAPWFFEGRFVERAPPRSPRSSSVAWC